MAKKPDKSAKVPLRGWLLAVQIWQYFGLAGALLWPLFEDFRGADSQLVTLNLLDSLIDVILFTMCIMLVHLRRKVFPIVYAATVVISYGTTIILNVFFEAIDVSLPFMGVLLIFEALIVTYLFRSKRVKRTLNV